MTFTTYQQGIVPPSTIVPQEESLFVPYFTRVYEDLASAINAKDPSFFTFPITDTATNIPNIANFGAYIICVSGESTALPCITAALSKASSSASGTATTLNSQAGTGTTWLAATLTISSTSTNFQIKHSVSGVTGNFNIKIIGTQ